MPPSLKNRKPKRSPTSSSARPTSQSTKSKKASAPFDRSKLKVLLGPLISLRVLLLVNSPYINLPNLIKSTPIYLTSLLFPAITPTSPPQLWSFAPHPSGQQLIVSPSLNHSLVAGTLLFSEPPLIVLPTSWKVRTVQEIQANIRKAVNELSEEDRAAFYALSELGGRGNEEMMQGDEGREMRIVRTNSVSVWEGTAGVFRVFPR